MTANKPHERQVGDLAPAFNAVAQRKGVTGVMAPWALTGATVTFTMVNAATEAVKVNAAAATVVTAADGTVKYDFASGDVDTPGVFYGFFTVTIAGETDTFPANPKDAPIWIHSKAKTAQEWYAEALETA
jgi:hypothetical protein